MMAQLSESTPRAPYYFPPVWNLFGEPDKMKFQWQPPSIRSSTPEAGTGWMENLQDWLHPRSLPTAPSPAPPIIGEKDVVRDLSVPLEQAFHVEDVKAFGSRLKIAAQHKDYSVVLKLCNDFNKRLKQSLIAGEVSHDTLHAALLLHRHFLPEISIQKTLARAFCREIWSGISTSKVVNVHAHDGLILGNLITILSKQPMSFEVQTLAHSILCSASSSQLQLKMKVGTRALLLSWLDTWNADKCAPASEMLKSTVEAEHAVDKALRLAEETIANSSAMIPLLEQGGTQDDWIELQRLVCKARDAIHHGIEAIDRAEHVLLPQRASATILLEIFQKLEKRETHIWTFLIKSCTHHVSKVTEAPSTKLRASLRFHYMSLVAQISSMDNALFFQTLETLNDPKRLITPNAIASTLLERWISQGMVNSPIIIRNEFRARGWAQHGIADLIYILNRHGEAYAEKTEEILGLLLKFGAYRSEPVDCIFNELLLRGVKLPVDTIQQVMNDMASRDVNQAYSIFEIWRPLRDDYRGLHIEKCPDFILALINSIHISSKAIWDMLGVPLYHQIPRHVFPKFSKDPKDRLWPTREALIVKMAIEFAQSGRMPRIVLRNIRQCILYLQIRGNPIPPQLTKALVLAGISMDIVEDRWVEDGRLAWTLKTVEQAEGTPVAESLDRQTFRHRQRLIERKNIAGHTSLPTKEELQVMIREELAAKEREMPDKSWSSALKRQWRRRKLAQLQNKEAKGLREQEKLDRIREKEDLIQRTRERMAVERKRILEWQKAHGVVPAPKTRVKKKPQTTKMPVPWERVEDEQPFVGHSQKNKSAQLKKGRAKKSQISSKKEQPAWGRLPPESWAE